MILPNFYSFQLNHKKQVGKNCHLISMFCTLFYVSIQTNENSAKPFLFQAIQSSFEQYVNKDSLEKSFLITYQLI